MRDIIVPEKAVSFIVDQRKGVYVDKKYVQMLYSDEINEEFEQIKPYLPAVCYAVLDIGCGVGGIDILLYHHYENQTVFCMLDSEKRSDKIKYGYNDKPCFYNSLDVTKEMLLKNEVSEEDFFMVNAEGSKINDISMTFDLVISLFSWGFHYPLSLYIHKVLEVIHEDGVIIVDIRKETDGVKTLEKHFNSVKIIDEGIKHFRMVVSEPKLKG